ncbi:CLUMA_CG001676, isoform A [Clunio marinus]|uniref:CLUMA_CG001676, isoform A n=1 Tax=Clunio marinus TaxID=568069 RepID=A0A1J1HNT4_9DIPT|nr:CLUMA_CG001676, isoform A [Clunio marinus]
MQIGLLKQQQIDGRLNEKNLLFRGVPESHRMPINGDNIYFGAYDGKKKVRKKRIKKAFYSNEIAFGMWYNNDN